MHPAKSLYRHLLSIYPRQRLGDGQQRGIGRSMCSTLVADAPKVSVVLKVTTPAWKNSPDYVTRCALFVRSRSDGGLALSAEIGICHTANDVQLYRFDEPPARVHWSRDPDVTDHSAETAALDRLDGYFQTIAKQVSQLREYARRHPANDEHIDTLSAEEIRKHLRVPQFGAGLKPFPHKQVQAEFDRVLRRGGDPK